MSETVLDAAGQAAMRAPVCELLLARGDRRARGWVDSRTAVLTREGPDGEPMWAQLPPRFVPDALARLNDLSPRPRIEPAERLRYGAGELAELLAARDAPFEDLREHWSVEARWAPAAGSAGRRIVEVLDTDRGLWLVVPDDPGVELWPTTPTMVFRLLCALLPAEDEVAAG